ncbi:MAG: uracil-DNA glycosylase [Dehalococcoidia bacterium]
MSEQEDLAQLIRSCPRCDLCHSRAHAVPGEGPDKAEAMFIGEAPGFYEDQQGRPFVGAAGKFLEQLLALAELPRQDVYITNIIKCRPPDNRDPLPKEIEACRPWLEQQLAVIQPKVVVTLGRYSLAHFFPSEPISKIHGQHRLRDGVYFLPMYHPAAALHQERFRRLIEDDFGKLPAVLAEARKGAGREEMAEPQQMQLF